MRERTGRPVALAIAFAASLAPAAHAQDIARVGLGSAIEELVAAPDGSAWVLVERVEGRGLVGRVTPDGQFRTIARRAMGGGVLGPDGQAWFTSGARELTRVDADLRQTRVALPRRFPEPFAAGSDGTLWTSLGEARMAHITPQGGVSYTPAPLPSCLDAATGLADMVRASDDAMWISDVGCDRLLRVTATGTTAIRVRDASLTSLVADTAGGAWFEIDDEGRVGHVDASGAVRRIRLPLGEPSDIAVGVDGSAWFAHGRCRLTKLDPAGSVTTMAAPIAASEITIDTAGRLLLAGGTRITRFTPGTSAGDCDSRGPALRVTPARGAQRISLRALRRGFRVTVGERAAVVAVAVHLDRPDPEGIDFSLRDVLYRHTSAAKTLRYRVPASRIRRYARRLAEGKRPRIAISVSATDVDGNDTSYTRVLRVTR